MCRGQIQLLQTQFIVLFCFFEFMGIACLAFQSVCMQIQGITIVTQLVLFSHEMQSVFMQIQFSVFSLGRGGFSICIVMFFDSNSQGGFTLNLHSAFMCQVIDLVIAGLVHSTLFGFFEFFKIIVLQGEFFLLQIHNFFSLSFFDFFLQCFLQFPFLNFQFLSLPRFLNSISFFLFSFILLIIILIFPVSFIMWVPVAVLFVPHYLSFSFGLFYSSLCHFQCRCMFIISF